MIYTSWVYQTYSKYVFTCHKKKHPSKKYSNAIKICNLVFEIHFYFHNEKENEQKRNQFMTDSEGIWVVVHSCRKNWSSLKKTHVIQVKKYV